MHCAKLTKQQLWTPYSTENLVGQNQSTTVRNIDDKMCFYIYKKEKDQLRVLSLILGYFSI